MSLKSIIAKCLRDLREKKGLTLKEVSQKTGIGISALGSYEQRSISPPIDKLRVISLLYDLEIDKFFSMVLELEGNNSVPDGVSLNDLVSDIVSKITNTLPAKSYDKVRINIGSIDIELE